MYCFKHPNRRSYIERIARLSGRRYHGAHEFATPSIR